MFFHIRATDGLEEEINILKNMDNRVDIYLNPDHISYAFIMPTGYLKMAFSDGGCVFVLRKSDIIDKNSEALNKLAEKMPDDNEIQKREEARKALCDDAAQFIMRYAGKPKAKFRLIEYYKNTIGVSLFEAAHTVQNILRSVEE